MPKTLNEGYKPAKPPKAPDHGESGSRSEKPRNVAPPPTLPKSLPSGGSAIKFPKKP